MRRITILVISENICLCGTCSSCREEKRRVLVTDENDNPLSMCTSVSIRQLRESMSDMDVAVGRFRFYEMLNDKPHDITRLVMA
jgi:hypothetical protein